MLYSVIQSNRPERFEELVQGLLEDGWELHGSPFVGSTGVMCQALTKTETKKKDAKVQKQAGS